MNEFECPFSLYSKKTPHHPAIISEDRTLTYLECEKIIQSLEKKLQELRIQPGDTVALSPLQDDRTVLLLFALFRSKAIAFPLHARFPPEQISTLLQQIKPSYLIADESLFEKTLPMKKLFGSLSFREKTSFLDKSILATKLLTSGSSGFPKVACHRLGNFFYSALGTNAHLELEASHRWLVTLPLFHVGGIAILFRCFIAGATVVFPAKNKLFTEMLHQDLISHLSFVPTQLTRFLKEHPGPATLKCILLGGAEISPSLLHTALEQGYPVYPTYGMTEMSSQITLNTSPCFSLGYPLPFREMKIDSNQEILVRGHTLFAGYLKEDKLHLPLNAEGWFATGDLGSFSKGGLKHLGRKDRLFISGGENIQPEEIEHALLQFPGMLRAHVTSIKDEEFGHRPVAYIEHPQIPSPHAIQTFLLSLLPKYKVPISFHPFSELSLKSKFDFSK